MSQKPAEIKSDQLLRYSKIADLSYYLNQPSQLVTQVLELKTNDNCLVLPCTIRAAPPWQSLRFDSFQAVCVEYNRTLIVAYSGTNPKRPADLTIDTGIGEICFTPLGGAILRQLIARKRKRKTWTNWSLKIFNLLGWLMGGLPLSGLTGRLVLALEYFDEHVKPRMNQYDEIIVVGHSLGGFVAAHVAYRNNITAYTFDSAPGVKYSLVSHASHIDSEIAANIMNHRQVHDPISGHYKNEDQDYPYPYGHLGWIYNWNAKTDCKGLDCHYLAALQATKFSQQYCSGVEMAPTNPKYW